jgi:hypothetical protein
MQQPFIWRSLTFFGKNSSKDDMIKRIFLVSNSFFLQKNLQIVIKKKENLGEIVITFIFLGYNIKDFFGNVLLVKSKID